MNKETNGEVKRPEAAIRVSFSPPATMTVEVDLDRVNPAWARGAFMNAGDMALNWYAEQAQRKVVIQKPGMAASMSNFLRGKKH